NDALPISAYLGVELVEVPVSPGSGTCGAAAVLAAVAAASDGGAAPAMVVLSAPSYPFGVLDPVAEVAEVTAELGIWLHVDACVGGWLLPWWPGEVPGWDFRVDRKSTRLNSSHVSISYAVFCLKKKR